MQGSDVEESHVEESSHEESSWYEPTEPTERGRSASRGPRTRGGTRGRGMRGRGRGASTGGRSRSTGCSRRRKGPAVTLRLSQEDIDRIESQRAEMIRNAEVITIVLL